MKPAVIESPMKQNVVGPAADTGVENVKLADVAVPAEFADRTA
jgi:hypothetical protein